MGAQTIHDEPTRETRAHGVEQQDFSADAEEPLAHFLRHVRAGRNGLSSREADRRVLVFGANKLRKRVQRTWPRDLARQFTHPLALLLWMASALAMVSGAPVLAAAIITVIVLNAVLAFIQEQEAARAIDALAQYLPAQAKVIRDQRIHTVSAIAIVPGDLIVVDEGDRICADARIVDGALDVDMSALTGEVLPAFRAAGAASGTRPLLEAQDLILSGTTCITGEAHAVVYATGMHTELGRIAALSERINPGASPLEKEVRRVAWIIAGVAVISAAAFLPVGILAARLSLATALTFCVGLLVGNVPEGLLPTITLSLADAVRTLARRGALVKRLSAVETLGSTTVICTDKTGTLTANEMRVTEIWTTQTRLAFSEGGNSETASDSGVLSRLLETIAACNHAELSAVEGESVGDSTEIALLQAAHALGASIDRAEREQDRVGQFHFDPVLRLMSTVDRMRSQPPVLAVHTKGAPEEVLRRCTAVLREDGQAVPLADEERHEVTSQFEQYQRQGLRVLGVAWKSFDAHLIPQLRSDAEASLVFLGLVAMFDPPRPEVAAAVAACHTAGIRILVATGDAAITAREIARCVGIGDATTPTVTGTQLDEMSDEELDHLLMSNDEIIFARSSPQAKLRIADSLRAHGQVVAMTGDGVNDAPALRCADIGVAMGRSGTDVAREAATMVLTDDNFATLVVAIEAGRRVYANIRKFIFYIFVHAVPEVVPFLVFGLSGGAIPAPLTPLQILSIDLGTDTLPALALGRENPEPGIMEGPPRPRRVGLITLGMLVRAWGFLGLLSAALVMLGYLSVLVRAGWHIGTPTGDGAPLHHVYLQATTVSFLGIVACQMGTAFAARADRASLRSIGVFSNRPLLGGVAFAILIASLLVVTPGLRDVFGNAVPSLDQVAVILPFPFLTWGADELRKLLARRRRPSDPSPASTSRIPAVER
jgi:calcium-translocating P-type ATPase